MFRIFESIYFTFFIVCVTFTTAKFPNNPKPCPYEDSECIKNIVEFLFADESDGYAPLNIINLNPLKISEIHLKQSKDSPVYIDLVFRNSEIHGLKGSKVTHVKGFGKDITQPHEIILFSKLLSLRSDYTVQGKVLILPVSGTGKSNLTMENVKMSFKLTGEPLVKNGKTYMHVKKMTFDLDTSRMYFDFENLYNGDKALGESTNLFLNENWKDVLEELRKTLSSAFGSIFKKVINNVFENYPYDELFSHE